MIETEILKTAPIWLLVFIYTIIALPIGVLSIIRLVYRADKEYDHGYVPVSKSQTINDLYDYLVNNWKKSKITTICIAVLITVVSSLIFVLSIAPTPILRKIKLL